MHDKFCVALVLRFSVFKVNQNLRKSQNVLAQLQAEELALIRRGRSPVNFKGDFVQKYTSPDRTPGLVG